MAADQPRHRRTALWASLALHLVLAAAVVILAQMPQVYSLSDAGGGGEPQTVTVGLLSPEPARPPSPPPPRATPAPTPPPREEPKPEKVEKEAEKPAPTKPPTPAPTPEPTRPPEKQPEKVEPRVETPKPVPTKAATPAPTTAPRTPVPTTAPPKKEEKKETPKPSATPEPTKTPFVLSPDRARDLRGTPRVPTRETPRAAAQQNSRSSIQAPSNPGPSQPRPVSSRGSDTASPVAAAGGGAVGAGSGASSLRNIGLPDYYVTNALNALAKHFRVPPPDQREVTAIVHCRINRDGTITNIRLKTSCGDSALDALATDALERARRFPPFPDDFQKPHVDVEISFFFKQ